MMKNNLKASNAIISQTHTCKFSIFCKIQHILQNSAYLYVFAAKQEEER